MKTGGIVWATREEKGCATRHAVGHGVRYEVRYEVRYGVTHGARQNHEVSQGVRQRHEVRHAVRHGVRYVHKEGGENPKGHDECHEGMDGAVCETASRCVKDDTTHPACIEET